MSPLGNLPACHSDSIGVTEHALTVKERRRAKQDEHRLINLQQKAPAIQRLPTPQRPSETLV